MTASQVQYIVKLFVIPVRTFRRRYNAKHQPSRQYKGLWMFSSGVLRSRLSRSSTLRSPISTTISIAENTQISFPLHANPCDPVPVQQIDGIINVPVPQIPGPIVEAVKHIPQEWVRQRVVLQIAAACGRYWRGAPRPYLGAYRRQCPSWDAPPTTDHPDRAKGTGSSTELFCDQTVGVLVPMQRFQLQFIDRFVDIQVVLRRSLLVSLNGIRDQKLSSGSVLFTFMTIHLYQRRFAGTEQY